MKRRDESIHSFHPLYMPGLEVIEGRNIHNEFRRHLHQTYIIGMVTQGRRRITQMQNTVTVVEREIFILNPGQVHSCGSDNPLGHSYKIISVSAQAMQTIASQLSEKQENAPNFKNIRYNDKELVLMFESLLKTLEAPESDMQCETEVIAFLAHLLLHFSEFPPSVQCMEKTRASVEKVCRYIKQNYGKNLALKDLAEVACLSPFHFQREFTRHMGITPHEYLQDFRISQAKKRLLQSENLADIAIQSGFADQSHFSRTFKKTVGISPGRYYLLNRDGKKRSIHGPHK